MKDDRDVIMLKFNPDIPDLRKNSRNSCSYFITHSCVCDYNIFLNDKAQQMLTLKENDNVKNKIPLMQ